MRGRTLIPVIAIAAAVGFILPAPVSSAKAAEVVAPGETVFFVRAEGGQRECRIKDLVIGELLVFGCGDIGTV